MRRAAAALAILLSACSGGSSKKPAGGSTEPVTAAVAASGLAFKPSALKVAAGTTVTWTNEDSVAHTVTSDTADLFGGPLDVKGSSFTFTFSKFGTFTYHCSIHTTMTGEIDVT